MLRPRPKKGDSRASEKAVFEASLLKMPFMHKKGNFNRRWREKIVDVSHRAPTNNIKLNKKQSRLLFLVAFMNAAHCESVRNLIPSFFVPLGLISSSITYYFIQNDTDPPRVLVKRRWIF